MRIYTRFDFLSVTFGIIIAELMNAVICSDWNDIITWGIAGIIAYCAIVQRARSFKDSYYQHR